MLVLAHRGYHQDVPENTLEAFAAATKLGVDGIETDLRLSADRQIVLYHDRLAPDGRPIEGLSRAELARLAGHPVPTLSEALDAQPDLLWNLEIKTPEVVAAALQIIAGYHGRRRLLITSFWHNVVAAVRSRTDLPCGLLEANRPAELSPLILEQAVRPPAARAIGTIVWSFEMIDVELLAEARARDIQNWAYGLHTPADHQRAVELQLDAVITDRPEFMPSAR
ncbi:MAG: glycerophosphodiester phosphodiesterase [Planctomycetaceae bacterium]|nr:glycerophosphodiester phosphodiesterase [Planctomycetaceae bacterium]